MSGLQGGVDPSPEVAINSGRFVPLGAAEGGARRAKRVAVAQCAIGPSTSESTRCGSSLAAAYFLHIFIQNPSIFIENKWKIMEFQDFSMFLGNLGSMKSTPLNYVQV